MAIPDMDDPATTPPEYVRVRTFDRVRRGYDPDQVRQYLDRVADRLLWTEGRLHEALDELTARQRIGEPFGSVGRYVADILRAAEEEATQIRIEAHQLMASAREAAARLVADARGKAEDALAQAASDQAVTQRMADVQLLTLIDFIQSTVERLAAAEQLLGPRSVELLDLGGTNGAAGDVPRGSAPGCVGEGGASRGPVPLVPGPGGPRDSGRSQPSNTIRVIELEPASAPNADDRPV